MLLNKLFLAGGGGGYMECGEVGCIQHREPPGPKIDPTKAQSKNDPENNIIIILHKINSDFV